MKKPEEALFLLEDTTWTLQHKLNKGVYQRRGRVAWKWVWFVYHVINVGVPLGIIHTRCARKLEHFSFDVAFVQCEHSYWQQQVPFDGITVRILCESGLRSEHNHDDDSMTQTGRLAWLPEASRHKKSLTNSCGVTDLLLVVTEVLPVVGHSWQTVYHLRKNFPAEQLHPIAVLQVSPCQNRHL